MTLVQRFAAFWVALSFLAAAAAMGAELPEADAAAGTSEPTQPRPRVTISKETTYLTEPLRNDGYVDYIAALNLMASQGVTPENNAAVAFCRAFGPSGIEAPEIHTRFFQMLGIEPLPEGGQYLVTLPDYVELLRQKAVAAGDRAEQARWDDPEEILARITKHPWTKDDLPELAQWLELNEEPLRLVVEGTTRPRYYAPMISSADQSDPGPVFAAMLPIAQPCRRAAEVLAARAMYRLGEGDRDAAWADLLACHRLARLCGQGPTLIDAVIAYAIDELACGSDAQLLDPPDLQPQQARKMLAALNALEPLPPVAERLDIGERCMRLDILCTLVRGRTEFFEFMGIEVNPTARRLFHAAATLLVDWDVPLRAANAWHDRVTRALDEPTHAKRREALARLQRDREAMEEGVRDLTTLTRALLEPHTPRQAVSRWLADAVTAMLDPPVGAARRLEDRAITRTRLLEIAFALAAYHAEHGGYPETLDDLVPGCLAELPMDLYTDQPYRYVVEDEGFLLYSLGPNMQDNGGKAQDLDADEADEDEDTSQWDDHRLRLPVELQ